MAGETLGPIDVEFLLKNMNFNEETAKMRSQLHGVGNSAVSEADRMNSAFKTAIAGMAAYFSFEAAKGFVGQLVSVRGEFQQMNIAFETMLGNKADSDRLMAQVVDLAAKTPFTLTQVGQGAKQLLAFQVSQEDVIDTLKRLGDVSAGFSVPIDRLITAYGQVKAKGKLMGDDLRQFTEAGIPMIHEISKQFGVTDTVITKMVSDGKVGFDDVRKVIENLTNTGGIFAGMMEKQSKSLTGMVSNLQDAWDRMLNDIGTKNEGFLASTITGATAIVDNYGEVVKVLKVLVATYGAYKAAVILTAVAQKVALAATMAKEYFEMAKAVGFATANQMMFNKSVLANPYAIAIAGIAGLITILSQYAGKNDEITQSQKLINKAYSDASVEFGKQKGEIELLLETVHKQSLSDKQRLDAIKMLKEQIPGYTAELSKEGKVINENTVAVQNYLKQLELQIKAESLKKELSQLWADELDRTRSLKKAQDEFNEAQKVTAELRKANSSYAMQGAMSFQAKKGQAVNDVTAQLNETKTSIAAIKEEYSGAEKSLSDFFGANANGTVVITNTIKALEDEISSLEQKRNQATDRGNTAELNSLANQIIAKRAELDKLKIQEPKKTADKTDIDQLKQSISDAKDLYKADLFAYQDYLSKKAEEAKKLGNTPTGIASQQLIAKEQHDVAKAQRDQLNDLVKEYQSYEQKRAAIIQQYSNEWLRLTIAGYNTEAAENDKKMKEELAALDEANGKKVDSYKWVFDNIQQMGARQLRDYISRLKKELEASKITDNERLKFTEQLSSAEQELGKKTPEAMQQVAGVLGSMSQLMEGTNKGMAEMLGNMSNLAGGVGDIMAGISSKNYAQVAAGMVQVVLTVQKLLTGNGKSWAEKEAEKTARLTEAINDTNAALERQIRLTELLQGLQKSAGYADAIQETADAFSKTTTDLENELKAFTSKINDTKAVLMNDFMKEKFTNILGTTDEGQKQLADIRALLNSKDFKDFTNADWTKVIDAAAGQQKERLQGLYEQWITLQEKQKEYFNTWAEGLTGTSYDSLVDGIVEAFSTATNSAEDFSKKLTDLLKNAVLEGFKTEVVSKQMEQFYTDFANAFADGSLSTKERLALTNEYTASVNLLDQKYKELQDMFPDLFATTGTSAGTLSGAIQGMDQQSADLLAGQLGAIRIHVADIAAAVTGSFNSDLAAAFQTPADMLSDTLGAGMASMGDSLAGIRELTLQANDILMAIQNNTLNMVALLSKTGTTNPISPLHGPTGVTTFNDLRAIGK